VIFPAKVDDQSSWRERKEEGLGAFFPGCGTLWHPHRFSHIVRQAIRKSLQEKVLHPRHDVEISPRGKSHIVGRDQE
jgi:hypothetical protein